MAMLIRLAAALATMLAAALMPSSLAAAPANCRNTTSFDRWLEEFRREALAQGVSARAIAIAAPYLRYDQGIINRDRGQRFFGQDFLTFSGKMLQPYRLQQGSQLLQKHAALFQRVEQRFGVPGPVLVAFWGLESDFGATSGMGRLPVLPSITTLA